MIRIVDLSKRFGQKVVFDRLNLTVNAGEIVVIMGGSGAGKSVLLKHIVGLMKPDSGDIFLEDVSVSKAGQMQLRKIRENFGIVFQFGALLNSLTVEENIALPVAEHARIDAQELSRLVTGQLELVDLHGIEKEFPANLSGGMVKRVAIARAIIRRPTTILYDEPTSGLDPVTARTIEKLILRLNKKLKITSIIVTHDIQCSMRTADRVAMLSGGKITAVGKPREIMNSDEPRVRDFVSAGLHQAV